MKRNQLRIHCRVKNCARPNKLIPKLPGIHNISVMRKRKLAFAVVKYQWLCVLSHTCSRCRIPHVPNTKVALKLRKCLIRKDLRHKPQVFRTPGVNLRLFGVRHRNAAGFLASVLQRKQPVIQIFSYILVLQRKCSHNTAFLMNSAHTSTSHYYCKLQISLGAIHRIAAVLNSRSLFSSYFHVSFAFFSCAFFQNTQKRGLQALAN